MPPHASTYFNININTTNQPTLNPIVKADEII